MNQYQALDAPRESDPIACGQAFELLLDCERRFLGPLSRSERTQVRRYLAGLGALVADEPDRGNRVNPSAPQRPGPHAGDCGTVADGALSKRVVDRLAADHEAKRGGSGH